MKVLILAFVIAITSSITLGWYAQKIRSGAPMVEGANRFLASLTPEKRARASFGFNDEERLNWHFVPRVRKGLPLKEMSQSERDLAKALLKTGLQQKAFLKADAIIGLELVLREIEKGSGPVRDPELYYVSIFGEPTLKGSWGWRVEGHHLALNFTVVNGTMIATAPSFFGSNPALVKEGPKKGLRILAAEEDLARSLVESLDEKQRATAIFDKAAPPDIISSNKVKADPLTPKGIAAGSMTAAQKKKLESLISEYLARMPADVAGERLGKLRSAGWDQIHFGWAGPIGAGEPHYYRVQGPTFLIEYDNTQNNANHIHSVWRDFDGDFGRDLLKEHYRATPHSR